MVDVVDKATRSRMMAGIGSKNTAPEMRLRRALHARGLRYRLHARALPGRPDIVFRRFHAALFVHGCFWHRHPGCPLATTPATRSDFWEAKFKGNVSRDDAAVRALRQAGWRVGIVWECEMRRSADLSTIAAAVERWLRRGGDTFGLEPTDKNHTELG